jgi:hypothetical protein
MDPLTSDDRQNSGRALSEAVTLPAGTTHVSLPLVSKSGSSVWTFNVSIISVGTGRVIASLVSISSSVGASWTVLALTAGAFASSELCVVVLAAADASSNTNPASSWFLAAGWVTNGAPAISGGAQQAAADVRHHTAVVQTA